MKKKGSGKFLFNLMLTDVHWMKNDMRAFQKKPSSQVRSCWVWCTADGRPHWMMDEKMMELFLKKSCRRFPSSVLFFFFWMLTISQWMKKG
jgi:hypothetical protein